MNLLKQRKIYFTALLIIISLIFSGCDDDFYLTEKETAAYASTLETHGDAQQFYGNLMGKTVHLYFDNSSGTPKLSSTNLVGVMRQTNLGLLETGNASVSIERLEEELKIQIGNWIEGKLDLYVDQNNDSSRLTKLESVSLYFQNNPSFQYNAENQSISFDMRVKITINGTIEINALNWLLNIFANVNGTYPLTIKMDDLQLKGKAIVFSPHQNGGRIRLQLEPKNLSPIRVVENGTSIPNRVKEGVEELLTINMSQEVDEVFHQDYDYFALADLRLTHENPNRMEVKYRAKSKERKTDSAKPQMHVVAYALDGKLYHSQKFKGDWSKYEEIEIPNQTAQIQSDPTLFHSGGNQLELAAVDNSGNLVYAHFRDEVWGNFKINQSDAESRYRGKPAVVASAPGQAEIIVEANDGNLFHLRRKNGVWLTPKRIPIYIFQDIAPAPYRKPVAVHVGNKIVVIFIDGENLPKAIDFDLETENWGQVISVSDQVQTLHSPTAVASGEDRIDVAYVGYDRQVYHRIMRVRSNNVLPNISTSTVYLDGNENTVTGVQSLTNPVLTASTFNQPELIVLGDSNKIYKNQFFNSSVPKTVDGRTIQTGWQNWEIVEGSFFSNKTQINGQVSEFDAVSTSSGRTEVVARNLATNWYDQKSIFHNSIESGRFSNAPWKTLNWRGWEQTQSKKFLGRPAIAVSDSNFVNAYVGKSSSGNAVIKKANLAELNITEYKSEPSFIKTTGNIVDPIILSTGTGIFDTIALKKDGNIVHTRTYSNGATQSKYISVSTSVKGMSATTYGNGYVELVAVGTNRKVYHWRFRDGNWSGGNIIADGVISDPIIKHNGAGQLELMGVDFDQQLKRWRFYDNQWHSKLDVSHTIRINDNLFNSKSASSWGDGTIDLVVVDKDTQKIYHRRIGPGDENCTQPIGCAPPRQFFFVGDKSVETPILSAFSPTRMNILAMKGLRWYSSWSSLFNTPIQHPEPPIQWEDFKDIGGNEMVIGNATNSGRQNLTTIATATGEIYINRNKNGDWSGFQKVYGQSNENILRTPIFLPNIASLGN